MMKSGYMQLWSRPYIFKERGGIRWPGVLSIHWNSLRRANLAADLQNLCDSDEDKWPWLLHVHLLVIGIWLNIPGRKMPPIIEKGHRRYGDNRAWGFTAYFTDHGALHLHWNARTKVVWWPWDWTHMRTEARRADGSWVPYVGSWERDRSPMARKFSLSITPMSSATAKFRTVLQRCPCNACFTAAAG